MIKAIISDANILIDYAKTNTKILRLAAKHLYNIYVPTVIADEVAELSRKDIRALGLNIIEPELEQIIEAATYDSGTSREDRLCFVLARDNKWACATNDKKLRRLCSSKKVACLWGFEVMIMLFRLKVLSYREAINTAEKIAAINPRISDEVVSTFKGKLKAISSQ